MTMCRDVDPGGCAVSWSRRASSQPWRSSSVRASPWCIFTTLAFGWNYRVIISRGPPIKGMGWDLTCRTSSPSRKVRLKLLATCFAMVDLPHAVAPVKKKTYRGRSSVGFSLIVWFYQLLIIIPSHIAQVEPGFELRGSQRAHAHGLDHDVVSPQGPNGPGGDGRYGSSRFTGTGTDIPL